MLDQQNTKAFVRRYLQVFQDYCMDQHQQSEAQEAINGTWAIRSTKSRLIGAKDDREDTDDATRNTEMLGIIMNQSHFNLYEPLSILIYILYTLILYGWDCVVSFYRFTYDFLTIFCFFLRITFMLLVLKGRIHKS